MTRQDLETKYYCTSFQAGDTDKDFFEWAIAYLLRLLKQKEK